MKIWHWVLGFAGFCLGLYILGLVGVRSYITGA